MPQASHSDKASKTAYRAPKVFLSHASGDKAKLVKLGLLQALLDRDIELYCDYGPEFRVDDPKMLERLHDIKPGENWKGKLWQMLDDVDVVLVCWSKAYVAKVQPAIGQEQAGHWVRDELGPAHEANRTIHIFIEEVDTLPVPYNTISDNQIVKIYRYIDAAGSLSQAYNDVVERAWELLAKIQSKFQDLEYVEEMQFLYTFLDRDLQEAPFWARNPELPTCCIFVVRGRGLDDPYLLWQRYRTFTWPARRVMLEHHLAWDAVLEDAVLGKRDLNEWDAIDVASLFTEQTENSDQAMTFLTLAISKKFASPSGGPKQGSEFQAAIENLKTAADQLKSGFIVYAYVDDLVWRKRGAVVEKTLNRLARELDPKHGSWLKFVFVIDAPPSPERRVSVFLSRLASWAFGRTFPTSPLGRYPPQASRAVVWHRLHDLNPLDANQCAPLSKLVALRWKANEETAQSEIRLALGEGAKPFAVVKPLLQEALHPLWMERRKPTSRDKARRS